ncbi:uncharacterized protein [Pseudorasbora parva]|uniref:uncharacterized protein n=1 Tax=Pseudorasbora parva TaxID=51549 RepID=UPI00351EA989
MSGVEIVGFWLLDRGSVTCSMDVLLSPRACPPTLSRHHCAVLRTLLRTGVDQAALKYLYSITPAMENIHDIKLCVDVLIQNKCISAAWALLRGLQTEDVHLFKHFIRVCENRGICKRTLATLYECMAHLHLTESRNMQSDEAQIQNRQTIGQRPVRTEPGQTPRPLSAWLYQMEDRPNPRDFVRILRQSISEICPLPMKKSVVLPKYSENSVNSPELSLSSQASCHVTNITSVDIYHEFKKGAVEEECEEALPLQTEEEMFDTLAVISSSYSTSSDSMESVGFITPASSSPSAQSAQELIVLKQNSSTVPEDEDKPPADMTPGCPDLTLTLEGATEALFINSLSRGSLEKISSSVLPGDSTHVERRLLSTLNLHPNCSSNEDNQSVCLIPEIPTESHNLLSPNHEKLIYHRTVDDAISMKLKNLTETEEGILLPREPKVEYDHLQDSDNVEESGTSSFLQLKPLRRVLSLSRLEDCPEGFYGDSEDAVDQPEILTSCDFTETMHDLLAHLQPTDLLADDREPYQACSLSALKGSIMRMDISLIRLSKRSCQIHSPIDSRSSLVRTAQLSLSQQSSRESRVSSTKEAVCFRTTSDRVGHCKLGGWWKQALETRRPSTGLLPALEQVSPVTREKRASEPRRPSAHGLGSFLNFPSNPQVKKREAEQAVKGELTGRRGSFKGIINQMDSGSTSHRGRRGKTSKRIKRA